MPVLETSTASRQHHGLPVHELVLMLETDRDSGLTATEAARRMVAYGPNELPRSDRTGTVRRLLSQLHNPLIYVLLAAGMVTLLLGEYVDSGVIFGVVVINSVVGFIQESKAEAALDALRAMVHTEARVVRDGRQQTIASQGVVPGDLVILQPGDKIPADLRLVAETELEVDESALTGESMPVAKDEVVLPRQTPVADRRNMGYAGTFVTSGAGAGIVVATGSSTELGEIHRLVGSAEARTTPLTLKLAWFSKVLTVVILVLAALTFLVGVARGESGTHMFTAAVALAVGAIPEGLPAAVTITLAIGVSRMARRGAVIRRLPAVETLGGATVVCTDKTGTLTENQMTVRALWSPHQELRLTGSGYATDGHPVDDAGAAVDPAAIGHSLGLSLLAGANCGDARLAEDGTIVGDPTEAAMLVAAVKCGLQPYALEVLDTVPFSSERQHMTTAHPVTDGRMLLVKGAVERVVDMCDHQVGADGSYEPIDREAVLGAAEAFARRGMRVLATAAGSNSSGPDSPVEVMAFTGLHAMQDPPRETARAAIASCRSAGIAVKMITGDHAVTARAIASQVGLIDGPDAEHEVLTGADIDGLDEDELSAVVEKVSVFARFSPEQKLRLVVALQSQGHVVAMTGDGVNDAPALKQADIGVAMGRSGTEVAKEAGAMVLTDDDFSTIEAAIEEGRGVFDNITKFIVWTLPTNMGEGFVILVAVLLGSALPILPTQILWINMTTAVALGLMLAWEPREPGIMLRHPRNPQQSLLTKALVLRTILVAGLLVAGSRWLFEYELAHGASLEVSRTAALNLFVAVEICYLFSCRSLTQSAWRLGWFTNGWVIVGVCTQVVGQLAITYTPVMNDLFQTAPLELSTWLRVLGVAAVAVAIVAADKWIAAQRR